MDSITKPPVTQDQLDRICRKHFQRNPTRTEELKDGWFNAAFLIEFANASFVLKVSPPDEVKVLRYEHNMMAAEVGATREVKSKTNLPVPKVVTYDRSREEVASDYFLAECVPGVPLDQARSDFAPEIRAVVDRQVGAHLKELHSIQGTAFGTYNQPTHATWTDAFQSQLENLKKDQQDQNIDLPPGAFEAVNPHMSSLAEVQTPTLIHWDLWDPNIFVDAHNKITGLIDFERAMWADPLMECNFRTPSPALLETYGHPITESPGAKARRALYDLHLFLIMVIESTYRHFDAAHEKMSREFLDQSIAALNGLE